MGYQSQNDVMWLRNVKLVAPREQLEIGQNRIPVDCCEAVRTTIS